MRLFIHQRGDRLIAQALLPYKYEADNQGAGMTALAGLPLYLDLAWVSGLVESIGRHLKLREGQQGWTDAQMVMALVLLNLAGGDHVSDLEVLEQDRGFARVLRRVETIGLSRQHRRALERRFRRQRRRAVPSASAVFRYLAGFHDQHQERLRVPGRAFIPQLTDGLLGLRWVNRDLIAALQRRRPEATATLDMDATLVQTGKDEALYCYQGFKAYQPLNLYWAEQGVVLHSEFRDGNVPAGQDQLRVLTEALQMLPQGVERVRLRSDTAGYQHDLLSYCEGGQSGFQRIEFAISCDVSPEFKQAVAEVAEADWQDEYREVEGHREKTGRQWAEVCFVPYPFRRSKKGRDYRYLALREVLRQRRLPGLEEQRELPFQTLTMNRIEYKIFGLVTNMDWEGNRLIQWQHGRCGKSEEVHKVMKEDLAGGTLPSGAFGENAAWWGMMVLALNLNAVFKKLVLGREWEPRRMKAVRLALLHRPGRVLEHARGLIVRVGRSTLDRLIITARSQIYALGRAGSG
jgi:hypothetical protein